MNATTQRAIANVNAKKVMDWAISSQASARAVEGSTTSLNGQRIFVENRYNGVFDKEIAKHMRDQERTKAEYQREYRAKNKDKLKRQKAEWYAANREREREKRKEHYLQNSEVYIARSRQWYADNRDRAKASCRQWALDNWGVRGAIFGRHRAKRLSCEKAIPSWYDHDIAAAMYEECKRKTESTGVRYHVDHIIPLRGDTVCGLHWHGNLQVITCKENCTKRHSVEDIV